MNDDPMEGYRALQGREEALGGVRLPSVYYTEREAEAAARAWRDGVLPFPAEPMRRAMAAFVARPWEELRALVPAARSKDARRGTPFEAFWNGAFYANLGHYAVLSGEARAVQVLRGLTELIAERYSTWPLLPGLRPGADYAGRFGQWADSVLLIRAARSAWSLRHLGAVTRAWLADFGARLARPVLEINTMPALEYRHDKYHNAMVDAHEAALLAGWLLGRGLRVRDVVDGRRAWNGEDLVEYVWNGPKGLAFFIANAFDAEGTYWELSHTYKFHCFHHLLPMLLLGRVQGRALSPAWTRRLSEALWESACEIFPNGEFPPLSETHPARHPGPLVMEVGAWLCRDARLRAALPLLDRLRKANGDPQSHHWGRFVHRLFLPATRPGAAPRAAPRWSDHLHPSSSQLVARSREGHLAVHMNWDAWQDYHSDYDALAFSAQHRGKLRLWDPGYHSGPHPFRFWVRKTCSHNTVTVNEEDQTASFRAGVIESQTSSESATWIQVSAPHVYAAARVRRYRRSLLILKTEPYTLVDVFEVEGGWRHRLHLLGLGAATRLKGERPGCVWRDAAGWAVAELFSNGAFAATLEPIFPTERRGPRKLVATRTGVAPLSSVLVTVMTLGDGAPRAARARVAFAEKGVTVSLPATPSRGAARLFVARSGASTLRSGRQVRRFHAWKGPQATMSRPIFLEVGAVEDARTIRTECMACWPLERGMTMRLGRRRYRLEAWQFSDAPLRIPMEHTAFEPRRIRLRFAGPRAFRAADQGARAWLLPPKASP